MPSEEKGNPRDPKIYRSGDAKKAGGLFGEHEQEAPRLSSGEDSTPAAAPKRQAAGLFGVHEPDAALAQEPAVGGAPAERATTRASGGIKSAAAAGGQPVSAGEGSEKNRTGKPASGQKGAANGSSRAGGYRKKKTFSKKQMRLNILIGGLIVILVASIILAATLPGCLQEVPDASSTSEEMFTESGYDPTANSLVADQFVGTILPETEKAGADYVKETLFLGDSNTVRMMSYSDVTGVTLDNAAGVVGMGIQAFTSLKCVKFQGYSSMVTMPEAVSIIQPRRVVITFGTNNVGGGSLDGFISSYEKALDAVKDSYPYADIIIGSVFPVDRYHENQSITMTNIDKFNVALAELAAEKGVKFLNWSEALRDNDKKSSTYGFSKNDYTISDGIHISRAGMEALFGYFNTHAYITEDTRPKPLKTVPKRLETPPGLITSDPTKASGAQVSSASAASASATTTVVTFVAGKGGTLQMGGKTQTSFSIEIVPGGTCPSVVAVPEAGYKFAGWSCTVGSISAPGNATLPGFYVYPNVDAAVGVLVSASFTPVASSSSAAPPPPVSSTSTPPPPPVSSSTTSTSTAPPPPASITSISEEGGTPLGPPEPITP